MTRQHLRWIWVHVAILIGLSGIGGYLWGGVSARYLAILILLWLGNLAGLWLWLHREAP